MRKFLVINMNYLGDALMTTPALAALRTAYPRARIDTVVGAGAAAEVLRGNRDLDEVIPRTAKKSLKRCLQVYQLLRSTQYTDVVILPPLPAYALTAWLARTPARIGLGNRGMDRFLTESRHSSGTHMADVLLDTMPVPVEARPAERGLTFTVGPDMLTDARGILREAKINPEKPWIAVNVGATRPQKRWFAESFAAACDELSDIPAVLIGAGAHDEAFALQVQQLAKTATPVNLVGKTTVKQLAAVLKLSGVLLTADSGPMHLATAVGTPTVALFGSTDPLVTGPYDTQSQVFYKNLPCAPCLNHPTCNDRYDCMREITPAEVAIAIRKILRQQQGSVVTYVPLAAIPLDILPETTLGAGE